MSKRDKVNKKPNIEKSDKSNKDEVVIEASVETKDKTKPSKACVMLCNVKYGGERYQVGDVAPKVLQGLFISKGFCKPSE